LKERGEKDLSHFESLQRPMKRSDFLKLTGATAGMYLLSGLPLSSKVNAADKEFSFAIFADTHTAPYEPKRSQWLKDIFNTMLAEETPPEFVLHVGDLVEAGLHAEYAEFASIVPPYYQDKLFGTKGNHEVRWDE
jgi:3',5'-cyclic AMP phosphodiesterase CpdA